MPARSVGKTLSPARLILLIITAFLLQSVMTSGAAAAAPHVRIIVSGTEAEAKKILSLIRGGRTFALLAQERSLDASRARFGELDAEEIRKLDKRLKKTLASLGEGDVSGVIKLGKDRFAILQYIDLRPYRQGAAAFRAKDFAKAEMHLLDHIRENPDAVKARGMLEEMAAQRKMPDNNTPVVTAPPVTAPAVSAGAATPDKAPAPDTIKDKPVSGAANHPDTLAPGAGKDLAASEGPNNSNNGNDDDNDGDDNNDANDGDDNEPDGAVNRKEKTAAAPAPAKEEAALPAAAHVSAPVSAPAAPVSEGRREPGGKAGTEKSAAALPLRIIVVSTAKAAEEVLSEGRRGKPFFFLAHDLSEDRKTGAEYGNLGEVDPAGLHPALKEAADALRPGGISGVIRLNDRTYAIIQMKDLRHLREADKALASGNARRAEEHLTRHIALNPDDLRSRMRLASSYEKRGETLRAVDTYEQALIFNPGAAEPHERLGKLHLGRRDYAAARDIFARGIRQSGSTRVMEKLSEIAGIALMGTGN